MNYVTKRIKVKAIQFSGLNRDAITAFCNDSEVIWRRPRVNVHHELLIRTADYDIRIDERDWILKLENGDLAGCSNDIFKYYYQPEAEELSASELNLDSFLTPRVPVDDDIMTISDYLEMMNELKGEENEHDDDK